MGSTDSRLSQNGLWPFKGKLAFAETMVMPIIICLLFLVLMNAKMLLAQANQCREYRLDIPGQSLYRVPVYNQWGEQEGKDSDICYGVVVAQMYDAFRFANGDTDFEHISDPIYLSAIYSVRNKTGSDKVLGEGSPEKAMEVAVSEGTCNRNSIIWSTDQMLQQYQVFDFYRKGTISLDAASQVACHRSNSKLRDIADLMTLLKSSLITSSDKADYIAKVSSAFCQSKLKKLPPEQKLFLNRIFVEKMSRAEKLKQFGKLVEQHPELPVAIRLDYIGIGTYGENSPHFMIVAGQRAKNGKCQILLRDSYGADCSRTSYRKGIECEEGKGSIWMDRQDVMKYSTDFYGMENKR